MNEETVKRLESLEKAVETELAKTRRSLILSSVGYGLLLLLVVLYTTVVFGMIKDRATPEALSSLAISYAKEQLPQLKQELKKQTQDNVPVIAERLVALAHGVIPQLEHLAKTQIDMAADAQIAKFQNTYMPELTIELKKTLKDAEASGKAILSEPNIGKGYAELFIDQLDGELAKLINENAKKKMGSLSDELITLKTKPAARLSARELAEKRAIIYWLFLVNNADAGQSPFSSYLKTFTAFAEHIDSFFTDDKQVSLPAKK